MHVRFWRRVIPALLITLIGSGLYWASPTAAQAAAVGVIDTTDKAAVARAYQNTYLPTLNVPINWTGSVASCDAGRPSAAGKDALITAFNYMRAMAGLPSVTENAAESANTQQAALMMQANGRASHFRPSDWPCHTAAGETIGFEIIAGGVADANVVRGYMLDPGSHNQAMGHRASILAAFADQIGVGSTSDFNAIHLVRAYPAISAANSYSWPPKGYFPFELAQRTATRWSFYPASGNASGASVSVTKNGTPLSIAKSYDVWNAADNYLDSTGLGWDMPGITEPKFGETDTYHVAITGIVGGNATSADYDVLVFAVTQVKVGKVTISGSTEPGATLTANVASVSPSDAFLSYEWSRGGSVVGWGSDYQISQDDYGRQLTVKVTGMKTGWTSDSSSASVGIPVMTCSAGTPTLPMKQFTLTPDMTGDKFGDVLAVDAKGVLWQYPGQSSGKLGKPCQIGSGFAGYQVYGAGDLDGDAKGDVLAISKDGALWLFHGNGDAALSGKRQVGWGWTGWRLIPSGDLDGDKKPDMLGINAAGDLFMYAGKGNGEFKPRVQVGSGWKGWELYAAGDLNRDGKNDILGVNSSGQLFQYTGKGSGWFNPRVQAGYGWNTFTLASGADVNGDGYADILGRNDKTGDLYFYKGLGNAKFASRTQIASSW